MTISILGSIIAAVVSMAIGFAWYSDALFGKKWRREMGMGENTVEEMKSSSMTGVMIGGFITELVMAVILSFMIQVAGVFSVGQAMTLAFWIWLGFVATIQFGSILWEKKSFTLYSINSLYRLVALLVMAIILMVI